MKCAVIRSSNRHHFRRILLVLLVLLGLPGCADELLPPAPDIQSVSSTAQVARPSVISVSPTPVRVPTDAPNTPTPTALPTSSPVPPPVVAPPTTSPPLSDQAITILNASALRPLRQIGYGRVQRAAVVPGSQLLAVATTVGVAWFELPSLQHVRFDEIANGVQAIIFSRNGQRVAFVKVDALQPSTIIEVRRVADGAVLTTLEGTMPVFSPDGQVIAAMQSGDQPTTQIWRSDDGEPLGALEGGYPVFSPDGQFIATVQGKLTEQPATLLWRSDDGALLLDLPGDIPTFAANGQLLATATNTEVHLWSLPEVQPAADLATGPVVDMEFSNDGRILRVALPQELQVWSMVDPRLVDSLLDVGAFGGSVSLSPGGEIASITSAAGGAPPSSLRLVRTADNIRLFEDGPQGGSNVTFSPDGTSAALVTPGGRVRVFDIDQGTFLDLNIPEFAQLAFSPDGQTLATARSGAEVYLWRVADVVLLRKLASRSPGRALRAIRFSPTGGVLAAYETPPGYGTVGSAVTTWDVQASNAGTEAWSMSTSASAAPAVWAFDLVTGMSAWVDTAGRVQLRSGNDPPLTLTEPGSVTTLEFSPDRTLLAVGSGTGTVQLLKTDGGYIYNTLQAGGIINALVFSGDGTLLAGRRSDGAVLVWRIDQQSPAVRVNPAAAPNRFIFSPNNQMLITGGPGGVAFYSLSDGQLVHRLDIAAQDVAIDPAQRLLAIMSEGRATVWGVQ